MYEAVSSVPGVTSPVMETLSQPTVMTVDMGGVTSSEYLVPDLTPGHYIVCVQVSHRHTSLQSQCFTVNIHNPVTDNGNNTWTQGLDYRK